ncbi:MAG: ABC transporter substrate-binding protein [Anaerolineales bacterium]
MSAMKNARRARGVTRRTVLRAGTAGLVLSGAPWRGFRAWPVAHAAEPRAGGTLVFALAIEAPSLEPHVEGAESRVRRSVLLYETLTYLDNELKLQPLLATAWETPNDTTYIFRLRPNVKFHNGKGMDAEDVKYTLDRILDPKVGAVGRGDLAVIDKVEVVDKLTVRFTLKNPSAQFMAALSNKYSGIIPKGSVVKGDELRRQSLGTGPFLVESWDPNDRLVLRKHAEYWDRPKPYLDKLIFKIVPDEGSIVAGLRAGTFQHAILEDSKNYLLLKDNPRLVSTRSKGARWDLIDLAGDMAPTDKLKVRQAIALAIDKRACLQAATQGLGEVMGVLPPSLQPWALPPSQLPNQVRDVTRARQLMAEAGHAGGTGMTLWVIPTFATMVANAQVIASNLKEIGIEVKIESVEYGIWIERYIQRKAPSTMNSFGGLIDPDLALYRKFHTPESGRDFSRWNSARADKLLEDGRTTLDPRRRKAIYDELQKLIAEEAPSIFLFSADIINVHQTGVKGYVQHPTAWYYGFRDVWMERS